MFTLQMSTYTSLLGFSRNLFKLFNTMQERIYPLRLTFTIEVHTIDYKVNILIIVFVEAKFIRSRKYKAYKCQKRAKIVTIEINVIKFLHTTGLGDDRAMGCLK